MNNSICYERKQEHLLGEGGCTQSDESRRMCLSLYKSFCMNYLSAQTEHHKQIKHKIENTTDTPMNKQGDTGIKAQLAKCHSNASAIKAIS